MRRATSALCVGRTMRTAMSASRRARSSLRLVSASSSAMPGWAARNEARIAGRTSQPTISLAVTRTTPRSAARLARGGRAASAAAAAIIVSTCGARSRAAWVGVEAARRAREQRHAERRLQRVDVPPDRRLAQRQLSRRARQAAVAHHLAEGAQRVPWRLASRHTKTYSRVAQNRQFPAERRRR